MLKIYITAFILSLVCLKSFSQDTINVKSPLNLQSYKKSGISLLSFKAPTNTDSINYLPFEEEFTTGSFETNQWTSDENWQIAGQVGNPAPSVEFNPDPLLTNYSSFLTSGWINGSGYIDGNIFVDFDLQFETNQTNDSETLCLEVYNGTDWITKNVFNNTQGFSWSKFSVDISDIAFGTTFMIRFKAEGEYSTNIQKWLLDNIRIYRVCKQPKELTCTVSNRNDYMLLEWKSPDYINSGWLEHDNGVNTDAIGLVGGGSFTVAARFTPAQLYQYVGTQLNKIKLFPYQLGGPIILKVWTGENASQLMISQPIESYTAGEWNEFILDNPVLISGTTELWFGYQVTHDANQWIAGIDAGPAFAGYGDMFSGVDTGIWDELSEIGFDANWNLAGFVSSDVMEETLLIPSSLTGYNIYKDNILVANTTSTQYEVTYQGPTCYNVTAVYEDCESEFSNTACTSVSVRNLDLNTVNIYPNPASSAVTIEWEGELKELMLIDIMGRVTEIYSPTPGNSTMTIDLTNIPSGVLSIKLETTGGKIGYAKLIRL